MIPDKELLKKKIAALEKNIKQLYDMLMSMKDSRPDEESAMLSKRYVGPANCASCDKNVVNLLG